MSLRNARLPKLADKIEQLAAKAEEKRAKLEKKDEKEAIIIKKSAKKK